ncbi:MAG TPA: 16S rRNA (cytosine(1402)-N(4))-methyltransferase RsmH [Candidatus Saccharimonadales bacterium]|nr:16S rRNA (cytosine(1402)-N(4))-methyltransferase RsmH [Candidatus Saccharimonadales bacterium]
MKNTNKNHQNKNKSSDKLSLANHDGLASIRYQESRQRLSTGQHQPVLLDSVLKYLNPQDGESYLDLTAGYGGHANAILKCTQLPEKAVLVDRDQQAIDYLKPQFLGKPKLIHQDFLTASQELRANNNQFDIILADLGVSSPHLDSTSRGFSVRLDGLLDMRMDRRQSVTAAEIVNNYPAAELERIIRRFGEEPRASKITRLVVAHRPYQTTQQLADVVARAWPERSRHHPATRTFQALRIAVNDELNQLEQSLPIWLDLLAPGGRLAVISFHSLEDRLVKQAFKERSGNRYDAEVKLLNPHPAEAQESELVLNPRARSAKLRAVVKINKKGDK